MALFVLEQVMYAFSYCGEPVSMPGSVCGQLTPDDYVVPAGSGKFGIPCARMQRGTFGLIRGPQVASRLAVGSRIELPTFR